MNLSPGCGQLRLIGFGRVRTPRYVSWVFSRLNNLTLVVQYETAAESNFPQGGPQNAPDLAFKTMNALRDIPSGLTVTNNQFPILRVFASWPADAKLDRSKLEGDEGVPRKKKDDDSHPLATLHLANFVRMSKETDVKWFRGLVERNEVIHLKRKRGGDSNMVL